jgi:hypothetical protein
MLFNQLKVAFRQLLKNKLYLAIDTLCMGVAIACAMAAYGLKNWWHLYPLDLP